jgi:predicted kinase
MTELILIRGIPGSGKSTLARTYVEKGFKHFESDQYFMVDGEYRFDASKLSLAHHDCFEKTRVALLAGKSVVVSNTFTRLWEMQNYINLAQTYQLPFKVIRCVGKFKNVHGVPDDILEKMSDRFELYRGEYIHGE